MADTKHSKLTNIVQKDPNFAVICSFLTKYGTLLGLTDVSFDQLEKWIEDTRYVNDSLKDLLMKLLKRWKHTVKEDRMHQYLVRFCHTYSEIDAWELESLGFQRCKPTTKLRVLKNLLECQFDHNVKFKEKINTIPSNELRCLPIGRDFLGKAYWFQMDNDLNMRIYSEEQDDVHNETWQVVVTDREELQKLITSLQEQKSHPGDKSRSATPSTIESDVASVEVYGQGALHESDASSDALPLSSLKCCGDSVPKLEASVSDASSDAVPLSELKFNTDAVPKADVSDDAENDDRKFASASVKVEPEEHGNVNDRVTTENEAMKVKAENLAPEAETVGLKIKDDELEGKQGEQFAEKQEPAAEAVANGTDSGDAAQTRVEITHPSSTASAFDMLQPDLLPVRNELEKVCLKTETDSLIENNVSSINVDNKQQTDVNNTDSVASNSVSETGCHPLGCEKNCDNNGMFADSEHGNKEHSIESMTDLTITTHSKCSSPQKSKKLVSKHGKATPPNSPAQKLSVKRKRISLCRISSSSSEDGAVAPLTESDLSDSLSADSHTLSAGEEEPPTKRKREKALKTAAERNRKSSRMKADAVVLSLEDSATQKMPPEETALPQDLAKTLSEENADKLTARNCIPDCEDDSVAKNGTETEKVEQSLDVLVVSEDCQGSGSAVVSVLEDSHSCSQVKTTTDKADKTADCESVLSAQRDTGAEVDGEEVAGKQECRDGNSASAPASRCSADESNEKECAGVKPSSSEASDADKSVHTTNTNSECSGKIADNSALNANFSEDKSLNDDQSVDTESHLKNDDKCENHGGTNGSDVAEVSTQSYTCEAETKSDTKTANELVSNGPPTCTVKRMRGRPKKSDDFASNITCNVKRMRGRPKKSDELASNEPPTCNAKRMRGRPKKSNKKGQKKRVHSNVTNTASVTEVQETDYEPTKKLGRPSKKSKLVQLAAEECDSLPQSEDDIPLIELRRSARANKGQRKLDQLVLEHPKKRNRAKDEEKERKRAEKEEKRRKREAELQEQAALKAKKKKRGKSDSDDDFVPGKKGLSRKVRGRGAKKTLVNSDSASSDATDEFYELFEPESEEEAGASSSWSEHIESDGSEYVPRGRNAKRAAAVKEKCAAKADDEQVEDKPCTRCGKSNQPEWILLCDRCDAGYHTACLRPPIMVIPEGDWFCPLCEHSMLIEKLQEQLSEFDKKIKLNVRLIQRKERLAYVTVNLSNIIQQGERRAISNTVADTDLYDDEASGEEECTQPAPTSRSALRKRASQRRPRYSSVSSSFVSSEEEEEEEEELSEVEMRHSKRKERRRLASDSEENWSYARRSCRQHKQINYKFEEFDELISGAIEDDVKEPDPNPKLRRSGKDMTNITGLIDLLDDKPVAGKQKKRSRHLTKLESDETEDESEEFQLSDADEASTADEDIDHVDEELSDESGFTKSRSTRRSNRWRQRSTRMNNFVSDDSEEYSDNDRSHHCTRRAAAKQRVNYHEISNSDTAVSDSERSSAVPRRKTAVKSTKQSQQMKDSDSEYQPSSEAEDAGNATVLSSQTTSRCKRLGSSSDESGSETVSKKKGRLNRIMSSSDYSSSDDDENPRTDDNNATAVNGDCQELPVVSGKHKEETDADAVESNSASQNNKGFTIANILKTPDRTVRSDNDSESSEQNEFSGEDSLSGIEDLVNYVTQS